jgi:hypothetical protein
MRQRLSRHGQAQSTGHSWHFEKLQSISIRGESTPASERQQLTKSLFNGAACENTYLDLGSDSLVAAAAGDVGQFAR